MATAFQSTTLAFETDAFQIVGGGVTPPVVVPTSPTRGSGGRHYRSFGQYLDQSIHWGKGRKKQDDKIEEIVAAIEQVAEVIELPVESMIFGFDEIALQMLRTDNLSILRKITSADELLNRIEDALQEMDDEDVILLLN